MKQLLLLVCLLGFFSLNALNAKEYKIHEIPNVHIQDATRYVSNPDGILNPSVVAEMDRMLYSLEQNTGIQTMVVAVTDIEGSDCFDFAFRLGKELGVGQQGRDNGLVVLLSTEDRCIQFVTGYGLEGVLPDAVCKRIQSRYMLDAFSKDDWNTGMKEGISAVCGYLDGSMENIAPDDHSGNGLGIYIHLLLFLGLGGAVGYTAFKQNCCPKCKSLRIRKFSSRMIKDQYGGEIEESVCQCKKCGHEFVMQKRKSDGRDNGFGGGMPKGHYAGGSGSTRRGGSFGGGSFGGGGAGSRF